MYVSVVGILSMSFTNKLSYKYSNGLYVSHPIKNEKINVLALYSILELVQEVLVNLHTTLLSHLIYYMTHHHFILGGKLTNTYLTTIEDAFTMMESGPFARCLDSGANLVSDSPDTWRGRCLRGGSLREYQKDSDPRAI